ncbi:helix-turn-helix domain-containing protein [Streptomyces sp. or20]|uniref:helix-turn-helix domain-containing protein n=1 Tax=Streptomyces sp. or20 TaxID=1828016 RepID=UPI000BEF9D3E|nr:helix-turn-helix domain-containing protein [Streptomyces sp. or20]
MDDEQIGHELALNELRGKLTAALAQVRLNQTQLARRAGLGRTTVSEALSSRKPVPSAQTVAALAGALRLPVEELLALQRAAAREPDTATADGPGRLIGEWDPHDLEVHPAELRRTIQGFSASPEQALPGYVPREHDQALAEAAQDAAAGRSRIAVLVGASSTGKTRACWEAVQPLAALRWRLWHPFGPTRAEAALEQLHQVQPRTVVWLNEAQHYLGDRTVGERISAAVHHLLVSEERGPVLVLATLWPEYAARYTALPTPDRADLYSRTRELLAGRILTVPDAFNASALAAATALAEDGDRLLGDALTRARPDGRITQDLAGAPELLHRYQHASPAAQALLKAAMDARRLGVGLHLSQAFLTDAASDYLGQDDYDQLAAGWAERAYAELAISVHGKQAPLRRTTFRSPQRPPTPGASDAITQAAAPRFRLADYLEQHGRITRRHLCPPASLWRAAHTHLTHPDDLNNIAEAAEDRHRLEWAFHLRHRAADHGSISALTVLTRMLEKAGDREGAEFLAQQAADDGNAYTLANLAEMREQAGDREGAEALLQPLADHGDISALTRLAAMLKDTADRNAMRAFFRHGDSALTLLTAMLEKAGDRGGAEALAQQAADNGDAHALVRLAEIREKAGDQEGAEALAQQAADDGNTAALTHLAEMREKAGDQAGAEALAQQAAGHGDTGALYFLAKVREESGDREGAESLFQQAVGHGSTLAMDRLARMREGSGDREGAEALAQQAASHGDTYPLIYLAEVREVDQEDKEGAESLLQQAAGHGDTYALIRLARMREGSGDREGAEALAQQAADNGDAHAFVLLARMREKAGDREGAEALAQQAPGHYHADALVRLAEMREEAGDREGAEALAQQAADDGVADVLVRLAEMREEAGDRAGAERLLRQIADHGGSRVSDGHHLLTGRWPHGLNPDGAPTFPWHQSVEILLSLRAAPDALEG